MSEPAHEGTAVKVSQRFQAAAHKALAERHSAVIHSGGRNFIVKDDDDLRQDADNKLPHGPCVVSSSGHANPLKGAASKIINQNRAAKAAAAAGAAAGEQQGDDNKHRASPGPPLGRSPSTIRPISGSRLTLPIQRAIGFSWPEVFTTLRRRKVEKTPRTATPSSTQKKDGEEGEVVCAAAGDDSDAESIYEEEEQGLRRSILSWILSWEFELFLLFLLVCDVIFLIVELELATRAVCKIEWEPVSGADAIVKTGTALGDVYCNTSTAIAFDCEHTRTFKLPPAFAACPFHVTEELPHHIHVAETAIAWCSRAIIIIFGLELITLLICAGPNIFILHKLYLLDAFIIATSVILDVLASIFDLEHISELVVLARVWRFARIVHGVGVSVHDVDEHDVHPDEHEELLAEVHSPGSTKRKNEEKGEEGKEKSAFEEAAASLSEPTKEK